LGFFNASEKSIFKAGTHQPCSKASACEPGKKNELLARISQAAISALDSVFYFALRSLKRKMLPLFVVEGEESTLLLDKLNYRAI
jgi:hypothetical protein